MRLLASGRDADVFDLGDGRVLRRHKDGRPATKQADLLRYAASQGYPVPVLHDASGPDLILEKLDGPEMQQVIQPWNLDAIASLLADLHRRLHAIPPMPGLRTEFGEPTSLLHLDLHPRNVLMTSRGPIVIDWANAANGPGQADVALMWVIESPRGSTGRYGSVVSLERSVADSSKHSSVGQPMATSNACSTQSPSGGNAMPT